MMDVYINVLMLIDEAIELFEEEKYTEVIEKLNLAWDKIQDKNTLVSEQLKIQLFLSYNISQCQKNMRLKYVSGSGSPGNKLTLHHIEVYTHTALYILQDTWRLMR